MDSSTKLSAAEKEAMIKRAIQAALTRSDGEDALHGFCASVQDELGITDGGPAGVFFSGSEGEEMEDILDQEIKLVAQGNSESLSSDVSFMRIMNNYIDHELYYLGDEDDDDN